MSRSAKLVPLRVPEKIKKQQVFFALAKPCTSAHHLTVKPSDFCRSEHDHTVNGRAVPPLCQKHTVAQNIVFSLVEVFKYFCPVLAVSVDLCGNETLFVQNFPEFLRCFYKRQKYNGFSVFTVVFHFLRYLIKIGVKSCVNVTCLEIPRLSADTCKVKLKRNGHCLYRRQITFFNCLWKCVLICKAFKN